MQSQGQGHNFPILGNEYLKYVSQGTSNFFWKEVLASYYDLRNLMDIKDKLYEPLWHNKDLITNVSLTNYKQDEWIDKGILYVCDLLDDNGIFLSYELFCAKYSFSPPFTLYFGLIASIRKQKWNLDYMILRQNQPHFPEHVKILRKNDKGCRDFYDLFILDNYFKPKSELKWEIEFQISQNNIWWKKVNLLVHDGTNDSMLKWFQYRLIQRILCTYSLLFKIGLSDSNLCSFCQCNPETLSHLFIYCNFSHRLWVCVKNWLRCVLDENFIIEDSEIIFGIIDKDKTFNTVICLVKYYLYKQKLLKVIPSFEGAKKYISSYIKAERCIYKKNINEEAFHKKWGWLTSYL